MSPLFPSLLLPHREWSLVIVVALAALGSACSRNNQAALDIVVLGAEGLSPSELTVDIVAADGTTITSGSVDMKDRLFPVTFNFLLKRRAQETFSVVAHATLGKRVWDGQAKDQSLSKDPTTTVQVQLEEVSTADSLAFVSPAQALRVGDCSAPLRIELRDAHGEPFVAETPVLLSVAADPATDLSFYSDGTCNTPLSGPAIATGTHESIVYFRSTRVGRVGLSVSSTGLTGAEQSAQLLGPDATALVFAGQSLTLRAGECSSASAVGLLGAEGQPVAANTDVTVDLGSEPQGRLTFFSDAACTKPITTLTVPVGEQQAPFFFKGLGRRPTVTGPALTTASASAPMLASASLDHNILPVVRRGSCTLANNSSTVECAVSPPQVDLGGTLLIFQAKSTDNTPAGANVRCTLSNQTTVTCRRSGTAGDAIIDWQTAELSSGLTVRRPEEIDCSGQNTVTVPVTELDPGSTFLLHSREGSGTDNSLNHFATVEISDATSARIRLAGTQTGPVGCRTWLQLASLMGATVTRGVSEAMTGNELTVSNLSSAPLSRSVLLYTLRSASPTAQVCSRMVRGWLLDDTSIIFSRGLGGTDCHGTPVEAISWERINFGPRASVQQISVDTVGGIPIVVKSITPVDLSRTLVFAAGQVLSGAGTGEGTLNSDDVVGDMVGGHLLASANTLKVDRASTQGWVAWTSYIVEIEP